jgi:hypothetical protein
MSVQYSLDIISVGWGTAVVTDQVHQIYQQIVQKDPTSYVFTFTQTIAPFGHPNYGQKKSFVMIWRSIFGSTSGSVVDSHTFSELALAACAEYSAFTLNYDGSSLQPYVEPASPNKQVYLLNAT